MYFSLLKTIDRVAKSICSQCFLTVDKGLAHNCTKASLQNILANIMLKDFITTERIAASIISGKEALLEEKFGLLVSRHIPVHINAHSVRF